MDSKYSPCVLNRGVTNLLFKFENSLRRHNYVGFVHALLGAMAKAGTLEKARGDAQKVMQERIARQKEKGDTHMDED